MLGYFFPVPAQRDFVASVTRDQARDLCEDFINGSEILQTETDAVSEKVDHIWEGPGVKA